MSPAIRTIVSSTVIFRQHLHQAGPASGSVLVVQLGAEVDQKLKRETIGDNSWLFVVGILQCVIYGEKPVQVAGDLL